MSRDKGTKLSGFQLAEGESPGFLFLREAGVPAYVPLRARDYHADPQLVAREFFIELDHGGMGRQPFDAPVTKFSKTPARPTRAGPLIGEHTFEVMKDVLGYTDDEISEIAAAGALS